MLLLHVTFHAKPGTRELFVKEVLEAKIAEASEAEEGNYYYDFFFSAENENDVMLLEKWENQQVLDIHSQQPHYQAIGEIKNKYILKTDIDKYEVK